MIVLFDDDEVKPAFIQKASLAELERLMNDEAIGLSTLESITVVKKEDLQNELLAIGNDGSFFDEQD